jgi:hypothetical protein
MAFSKGQSTIAWVCLALMAGMLLYPPWTWLRTTDGASSNAVNYAWLWAAPPKDGWRPILCWPRLRMQLFVVAVGMLLLLYLREARDRAR